MISLVFIIGFAILFLEKVSLSEKYELRRPGTIIFGALTIFVVAIYYFFLKAMTQELDSVLAVIIFLLPVSTPLILVFILKQEKEILNNIGQSTKTYKNTVYNSEKNNKKTIYIIMGVVLLLITAYVSFAFYLSNMKQKSVENFEKAIFEWTKTDFTDDFKKVLDEETDKISNNILVDKAKTFTDNTDIKTYESRGKKYGFSFNYPKNLYVFEEGFSQKEEGLSNEVFFVSLLNYEDVSRTNRYDISIIKERDVTSNIGDLIGLHNEDSLKYNVSIGEKIGILYEKIGSDNCEPSSFVFKKENYIVNIDSCYKDEDTFKQIISTFKFIDNLSWINDGFYLNNNLGISFKYPSNWTYVSSKKTRYKEDSFYNSEGDKVFLINYPPREIGYEGFDKFETEEIKIQGLEDGLLKKTIMSSVGTEKGLIHVFCKGRYDQSLGNWYVGPFEILFFYKNENDSSIKEFNQIISGIKSTR